MTSAVTSRVVSGADGVGRRTTPGVPVTRPIVNTLPAIYQDISFIRDFTRGLDEVLAPVVTTLDCLDAYVDPSVAPADFVAWLGGWVGVTLQEDWSLDRRRTFVARAADLFARRGTVHGLHDEVELYTAGTVEVVDGGGVMTSRAPTDTDSRAACRPSAGTVRVNVTLAGATGLNRAALHELIRDAVPAHLPVEIDVCDTSPGAVSRGEETS